MRKAVFTLIVAGAALLGACATAGRTNLAPQAPIDRIEMETRSFWFALGPEGTDFVSSWRIDANGTGLFRSVEAQRVGDVFERRDVVRRIFVGRTGFRRIAALLAPAEGQIEDGRIRCDEVPYTYSPHGYIAWTRGGAVTRAEYNQGCPSTAARRIFARMDEAEKLMSAWGAKGRIVSSERLPDKP
jgi:hypothetical protein